MNFKDNDTLAYNVDNMEALVDFLNSKLSAVEKSIEELYYVTNDKLNSPQYWQGETYNAFRGECAEHKKLVESVITDVRAWIGDMNIAVEKAKDTTASNVGLF